MLKIYFYFILSFFPIYLNAQLKPQQTELLRQLVASKINALRSSKGIPVIKFNDTLKKAAEFHSAYMAANDTLTHNEKSATYKAPKDRVLAFKGKQFELIGENVLYSSAQKTDLNQKDIEMLAEEMFQSWKNSPIHYANMIETEYDYGDLGFEWHPTKHCVFATHVFGKRGFLIRQPLSENAFGLVKATKECENDLLKFQNIIANLPNGLHIVDKEVKLSHHNISLFEQIFTNANDGIAIDLTSEDQLRCGRPNQLDVSPVYDGIILQPVYRDEILAGNEAKSIYHLISTVGRIPEYMDESKYEPSIILIKNGKACQYLTLNEIDNSDYELKTILPYVIDEPNTELVNKGIAVSQVLNYQFKPNALSTTRFTKINPRPLKVKQIQIKSFSSVDGDSIKNAHLHNARAQFIQKQLQSKLGVKANVFEIEASENWKKMNYQLNYYLLDSISKLPHYAIKSYISRKEGDIPWMQLMSEQRKSLAIVHYEGNYHAVRHHMSLAEFNLRTGVFNSDEKLVNKALYFMYQQKDYHPQILFEPQIVSFIQSHPRNITNYLALLSENYLEFIEPATAFMHGIIQGKPDLDSMGHFNLMHLYTLIGKHLLDEWDVSSERLSNVIHPIKMSSYESKHFPVELVLNIHLSYIDYFGQVNDKKHTSSSFNFISEYLKNNAASHEDDVKAALFFNHWSRYDLSYDLLLSKFKADQLNEDGLFLLVQTVSISHYAFDQTLAISIYNAAIAKNPIRWCEWVTKNLNVKRDYKVKGLYCELCP